MIDNNKLRSPIYLDHIRAHHCLICETPITVQAHHMRHVGGKGVATKTGDQWAVPMCSKHHQRCHGEGDEGLYWIEAGIDAVTWAEETYATWRQLRGHQSQSN